MPRDLGFSRFCEQVMLKNPPQGYPIADLGRSGRQFQLCYNLRGVTLTNRDIKNPKNQMWSIRQSAIHHQFDVVHGTTLWIITKGRVDILDRFQQLTGPEGRLEDKCFRSAYHCFRSSLAAHLMYCHWSSEDWHKYISWIEQVFESEVCGRSFTLDTDTNYIKQSSMVIYGRRGPYHQEYKPSHIQQLQLWKDKISEVVMMLEANMDVISSLRRFYTALQINGDFPFELKKASKHDVRNLAAKLSGIIMELSQDVKRAKVLVSQIGDRKDLVSFS